MRSTQIVHTVSCHAEGEVGDVIVGGVPPPPGATLWEQSRWIAADQSLRNFMLNEPRGGVFRHVNLLVPPKDSRAQMGFIIMEPVHTPPMSGSNSICVATVLLETGIVPMTEPVTHLVLEAPGGLIEVTAACRNGKAERITVTNVPSFADRIGATLEVEGVGTLTVDTAYGGDSFVIVSAGALGFQIVPDEARDIAEIGVRITRAANEQIGFVHPENPGVGTHLILPGGWADHLRGWRCQWRDRRRDRAGEDRPLSDRHRLLGTHGGAPCAGRVESGRPLRRKIDHRLALRLPDRARGDRRRQAGDRAIDLRPRLHHRNPSAHARSRRSLAARLSAFRHVASQSPQWVSCDAPHFVFLLRSAEFLGESVAP